MNTTTRICLAAAVAAFADGSLADDYHYNNALIGSRASGLGGAYTAVADDPSGLYYNPAGIVYAGGVNYSASVNAYHKTRLTYKNVFGIGDWSRESSTLLPNFFGMTQPLGKGIVGFSYAVPDSILENQDQDIHNAGALLDRYIINVNNEDNTYKLGPSYAISLSDKLAIGMTLYAHIRNSETIVNQVIFSPLGYDLSNNYLQIDETGFEPVLGVMWSPFDRLSVGLALRKTTILSSETISQNTCASSISSSGCVNTDGEPHASVTRLENERNYPLMASLGISYFPSSRLLMSFDYIYYSETEGDDSASVDSPFRTKAATYNIGAGVEYYLSDTWAMRAGFFTNRANTLAIDPNRVGQPDHVDLTGMTLSISRFTRNSSVSVGFAHATGKGEAQVVQGIPDIQDLEAENITLFLSTSYTY